MRVRLWMMLLSRYRFRSSGEIVATVAPVACGDETILSVVSGDDSIDCLPYPSPSFRPVTLTLSLSRRAGEGICLPTPPEYPPLASLAHAYASQRGCDSLLSRRRNDTR